MLAPRNAAELEAGFQRLDQDRDGKLSRAEYGRPRVFAALDEDGDGFLSLAEARRLITEAGKPEVKRP